MIKKDDKILLMTLPFLTPLIPPLGIACLKSYLKKHGFNVVTHDSMVDYKIRELCYQYFDKLESFLPPDQRGFFFNIALDVIVNHFRAHLNYTDKSQYLRLIQELVYKNFYTEINDKQSEEMVLIVQNFYNYIRQNIIDVINKIQPAIVGLSVYKGTLGPSLFAATLIHNEFSHIKILMGGTIFAQDLYPGTPNYLEFIKRYPFIDKIFIGESELLFLKYLQNELPESQKAYTLQDIDNQMVDLDTLELPDFSDFSVESYPVLPMFTSRGCVARCSFCAETVFWKKYHRKSPQKVVRELIELSQRYNRKLFIFTDSMINPIINELAAEIIKSNLNVYWDVYFKLDKEACNPENVFLWRKAGFYRARVGAESGSQRLLNLMDKRASLEQIKTGIINLAKAGIKTSTYWIAGHPGETEEDFQLTLNFLEELQDYLYEAECDPFRFFYRGQVNAEQWKNNGLLYSEEFTDMLMVQTWRLYEKPEREVIFEREFRFKEKCKELGIPNPYSVAEINQADKRWKVLQKNAVPALMAIDENASEFGKIKVTIESQNTSAEDIAFNF